MTTADRTWPYTQRRRWWGRMVGCLLCPTMVQPTTPGGRYGRQGTIEEGLRAHLEWVHGVTDPVARDRVVRDCMR